MNGNMTYVLAPEPRPNTVRTAEKPLFHNNRIGVEISINIPNVREFNELLSIISKLMVCKYYNFDFTLFC